jgi:uncharacterized membrane protein YedE/YeeE
MSSTVSSVTTTAPSTDRAVVAFVCAFILASCLAIGLATNARQSFLFLIGTALGLTLYRASFGFGGGWRLFVREKRGTALRAQMLMIAVAAVTFIPLLAANTAGWEHPLVGAFAPAGVSVLVGALMFGVGMQVASGCASGTLYAAGGGESRMLVVLLFFIVGSLVGTVHLPWWLALPSFPVISLGATFGVLPALLLTLSGLGGVAFFSIWIEKKTHGSLEALCVTPTNDRGRGPWSLATGALVLAGLNVVTLLLAGHPWSITYAFGLWGAKAAQAVGVAVTDWTFWTWPMQVHALQSSVLADVTSVMNFGIMLGAALAAGLAGKFGQQKNKTSLVMLLGAILGGLLMGYGARLSFGCNIGALFSGIASGSAHGWLWFVAAFAGSLAGMRLRPLFGLD